jgi:hypothetical protein
VTSKIRLFLWLCLRSSVVCGAWVGVQRAELQSSFYGTEKHIKR